MGIKRLVACLQGILCALVLILGGCGPSVETTESVKQITSQARLAKIAVEHKDPNVRLAAIKKLTDQALLEKIARDGNEEVFNQGEAVERLTDQAILSRFAMDEGYLGIMAIKHLTDQPLLAEVALTSPDDYHRTLATEKITDRAILIRIVAQSKDPLVTIAAAKCLDDKALLTKMSMWNDPDRTRQVRDQTLLKEIALRAPNANVRLAAIENLTDQPTLAKLVEGDKRWDIRIAALRRITDQTALEKVAVTSPDPSHRRAAAANLTDPVLRARIAREDKDSCENQAAMAKKVLEDPAMHDPKVRGPALAAINEPHALAMIAFGSADSDCGWDACCKFKSPLCLTEFAATAKDPVNLNYVSALTQMNREWEGLREHKDPWSRVLFDSVVPLVDPVVLEDLGCIEVLEIRWQSKYDATYGLYDQAGRRIGTETWSRHGEAVSFVFKLSKMDRKYGDHFFPRWQTEDYKGAVTKEEFSPAPIGDPRLSAMQDMCQCVSLPALKRIASESRDRRFREVATLALAKRSK